jgi:hemolysin activation/secretion protein
LWLPLPLFSEEPGAAVPVSAASPSNDQAPNPGAKSPQNDPKALRFFVKRYRVVGGAHILPALEVETAVYPYLGPYRTADDVEQARAALEKTYRDKGFQTVTVEIPAQNVKSGVIVLQVVPNEVGRLRVEGSRYFSLDEIKKEAPSLQEGKVPNFNDVQKDLVTLNQLPDRQVTPTLSAGRLPGTVDVNLNVKDSPPLHGSLELNNRYSVDTTPLRINASASYDNLWQLGHSISGSFQLSPEDISQVQVFSGYYLARIPGVNGISFMLQGTDQNSSVNTLGNVGVAGAGQTIGGRAIFTLPSKTDFFQSISLGFDYKHNTQDVIVAGIDSPTPITYYPISAAYSGTWLKKDVFETDLNASVIANTPFLSSSDGQFNLNRYGADNTFIYFRGDLSHEHELPGGLQIFGKVQGQAADQPLVSNEQYSVGGLSTVRGYLESEVLGDNAILGSVEVRSPSLTGLIGQAVNEWRFYIFSDWALAGIDNPLPQQQSTFDLGSVGAGTRFRLWSHFNGSFDAGIPLVTGPNTSAYSPLLTFRLWAEF